jgi:hypothetical protein
MAKWYEPTDEARKSYEEWCAERPPEIAELARKFPPWNLYRLGKNRVYLIGFSESKDGTPHTCMVQVSAKFNYCAFERNVFGIKPEELVECDPPGPDEQVGVFLNEEQTEALIESMGGCDDPDCAAHKCQDEPE